MIKTEWEKNATNILKAELTRRGIGYEDLHLALKKIGVDKPAVNLNKTINLGKFSFTFFMQCAKAIGLSNVNLT